MEILLSSTPSHRRSLTDLRDRVTWDRLQGVELVVARHAMTSPGEMKYLPAFHGDDDRAKGQNELASIRWLILPPNAPDGEILYWQRYAHVLRAGLVVQQQVDEIFAGVRVAVTHGTCLTDAEEAVSWARSHDAHTCWEIEPGACDIDDFDRVLSLTLPYLTHVRLLGTDPQVLKKPVRSSHVDVLMRMLSRRQMDDGEGFTGTIALVPSAEGKVQTSLIDASNWSCCTAA